MHWQAPPTWTPSAPLNWQPVGTEFPAPRCDPHQGIIFSNGETWRQQRRFGLMALRKLALGTKTQEGHVQDEACRLLRFFQKEKGNPVDPACQLANSMANVICAVAFGRRFSIEDPVFRQLITTIDVLINTRQSIWGRVYDLFPWLMHRLPGPHQRIFHDAKVLRAFILQEIRSHQKDMTNEPQDLIDYYLHQIAAMEDDPKSTYNEENLIQVVADLFMAGTEATTTTLLWALLYMVAHPHIQENVQNELDAVVGSKQLIEYEDRKRLPYTNAVIHEIQRYGNVIPVGPLRQCIQGTTLLGIPIAKGTFILPNISSVLHDPEHWKTPQQFNPDNFLNDQGQFVCSEAFLPFLAGHRVCFGEQLARMELFTFFTNLLRSFTFQLPESVKHANLGCVYRPILKPLPYEICAIPR
ncbi:cytochrome P450 2J5-like isoform X2 [Pleurodeles waltl]|uniref:cytochrome P450 2J5-like isoform X2 n=1 Tax=Pleurodeles waltl TaxID=8319 RepID=UPI0037095831